MKKSRRKLTYSLLLKPLQMTTTVLSADKEITLSLVRPIVYNLITKHFKIKTNDTELAKDLKSLVVSDLKQYFDFEDDLPSKLHEVNVAQIASLLDSHYKNLQFEGFEVNHEEINCTRNVWSNEAIKIVLIKEENHTIIDILLGDSSEEESQDEFAQYLLEPQINYNLNPSTWWKKHEKTYGNIAKLVKKFLLIPATSMNERIFSSA